MICYETMVLRLDTSRSKGVRLALRLPAIRSSIILSILYIPNPIHYNIDEIKFTFRFLCFIGFRYYDFFFPFSILPTSTLKPYVITVSKDVHNFILLQISVTHKRLLQTVAFMEVRSCPPSRYIDHSPTTTLMTFTSSLCIPKSPSHPRGIPTPLKQCISGGKMGRFLLPAFLLLFDFIPFSFFSCVAIFFNPVIIFLFLML